MTDDDVLRRELGEAFAATDQAIAELCESEPVGAPEDPVVVELRAEQWRLQREMAAATEANKRMGDELLKLRDEARTLRAETARTASLCQRVDALMKENKYLRILSGTDRPV